MNSDIRTDEDEHNQSAEIRLQSDKAIKRLVKITVLVIVVLILFSWGKTQGWYNFVHAGSRPDPGLHQAVFLTNGQVYFGKIDKMGRDSMILRDIYYLQVLQPLQQREPDQQISGQSSQQNSEPTVNLVKMGSEIHGPTDKMVIPMVNVLFWEDIKSDGIVGKAITEFKSRQDSSN